jgi:hypothetical protein
LSLAQPVDEVEDGTVEVGGTTGLLGTVVGVVVDEVDGGSSVDGGTDCTVVEVVEGAVAMAGAGAVVVVVGGTGDVQFEGSVPDPC